MTGFVVQGHIYEVLIPNYQFHHFNDSVSNKDGPFNPHTHRTGLLE